MRTADRERTGTRAALRPALRWVARHVRGAYASAGVVVAAGAALLVAASLAFVALAEAVDEGETQAVDTAILRWMGGIDRPWIDRVALEVTALGATVVVWMLVAVASAFLWATRHRWSVLLLLASIGGAGLLSTALKYAFGRPRPDVFPWRTPGAALASFPSGHSLTGMVAYGTLAVLVARLAPTAALRRLTVAVAAVVVLLIGLSRMWLGVHWPSDVLGGWMSGAAWAAFCALGVEALRQLRTQRRAAGRPALGDRAETAREGTRFRRVRRARRRPSGARRLPAAGEGW